MTQRIDFMQARDILVSAIEKKEGEILPIEKAYGRVCFEDVEALVNVPAFDRSPFDGYAFCAGDTAGELPVTLEITEEIPAGSEPSIEITSGFAAKILTGAPVPKGVDAVTKFEETDFTDKTVTLKRKYKSDENIIHTGENIKKGEVIARKGQVIDAGLAGALASVSIPEIRVYRIPVIGIITTGSELVEAGNKVSGGKIPNSNRYAFEAAVKAAGCIPMYLGAPGDSTGEISKLLNEGLSITDAIITTGGASVGDYDMALDALKETGAEILCGNLALKPGGKCWYGKKDGKLIFSLSGNPASAMTNYYAAVLPALRKLSGKEPDYPAFYAYLSEDFGKAGKQPRLIRGNLEFDDGRVYFRQANQQGNGALHSMAGDGRSCGNTPRKRASVKGNKG